MIKLLITTLWYILPAIFANSMTNIIGNLLKENLAYPIDFNLNFKKKRLFGKTKTWRGVIIAIITGILIMNYQKSLFLSGRMLQYTLLDYSIMNTFFFGGLMGFSVMFGDTLKSFFKRRFSKKSGERWIPFDQLDIPLGFSFFIFPILKTPTEIIVATFIISPILAFLLNQIGFILKLKNTKW